MVWESYANSSIQPSQICKSWATENANPMILQPADMQSLRQLWLHKPPWQRLQPLSDASSAAALNLPQLQRICLQTCTQRNKMRSKAWHRNPTLQSESPGRKEKRKEKEIVVCTTINRLQFICRQQGMRWLHGTHHTTSVALTWGVLLWCALEM